MNIWIKIICATYLIAVTHSSKADGCSGQPCSSYVANPECPAEGAPGYGDDPTCAERTGCTATPAPTTWGNCDPVVRVADPSSYPCPCEPRRNPETGEMEPGFAATSLMVVYYSVRVPEIGICNYTDADPQCCSDKSTSDYCNVHTYAEYAAGQCITFRNPCQYGMVA